MTQKTPTPIRKTLTLWFQPPLKVPRNHADVPPPKPATIYGRISSGRHAGAEECPLLTQSGHSQLHKDLRLCPASASPSRLCLLRKGSAQRPGRIVSAPDPSFPHGRIAQSRLLGISELQH